jgi:hypothetical protein
MNIYRLSVPSFQSTGRLEIVYWPSDESLPAVRPVYWPSGKSNLKPSVYRPSVYRLTIYWSRSIHPPLQSTGRLGCNLYEPIFGSTGYSPLQSILHLPATCPYLSSLPAINPLGKYDPLQVYQLPYSLQNTQPSFQVYRPPT